MNRHCQCSKPGYCERHKMTKDLHKYHMCNGTSGTYDCGMRFWNAWEDGRDGATKPEIPIIMTAETWECDGLIDPYRSQDIKKTMKKVRRRDYMDTLKEKLNKATRCLVGTRVKLLIAERYWQMESGGCGCKDKAALMDRNGCAWCKEHIDDCVLLLKDGARQKKILAPIVSVFGGTVESLAKSLIKDAIEIEEKLHCNCEAKRNKKQCRKS